MVTQVALRAPVITTAMAIFIGGCWLKLNWLDSQLAPFEPLLNTCVKLSHIRLLELLQNELLRLFGRRTV